MTMLPLDPETTPAATVPTEATASGTMTPEVAASEATDPSARAGAPAPRQTLAMRLAERSRMRAQRAERLARLRPGPETPMAAPVAAPIAVPVPLPAAGDAEAALEDFLRALTGGVPLPPAQPQEAAEVLPFQRVQEDAGPEGAAKSGRDAALREIAPQRATTQAITPADLDRLPGVGPGLVGALERAGLARLADIAPLAPTELAARLGPIGRLVPTESWIATARAAEVRA